MHYLFGSEDGSIDGQFPTTGTSVVYPGSLPSTAEFRSQLHSASLDDLKKIHGILRIRRAGNRADYRSRLETTFDISLVIATLALS